jgi:peptide deformylase
VLKILLLGNETLKKTAEPVKDIDQDLREYTQQMLRAMKSGRGIGLAAPQVGRLERFFVCQVEDDEPRVFINPEIIRTSTDEVIYEEGCLSIPNLWANVKRPSAISIQAWNEKGRPFTLDAEGILARVIQHEFDHLNGVLFIDRLSETQRKRLIEQFEKRMRM